MQQKEIPKLKQSTIEKHEVKRALADLGAKALGKFLKNEPDKLFDMTENHNEIVKLLEERKLETEKFLDQFHPESYANTLRVQRNQLAIMNALLLLLKDITKEEEK